MGVNMKMREFRRLVRRNRRKEDRERGVDRRHPERTPPTTDWGRRWEARLKDWPRDMGIFFRGLRRARPGLWPPAANPTVGRVWEHAKAVVEKDRDADDIPSGGSHGPWAAVERLHIYLKSGV